MEIIKLFFNGIISGFNMLIPVSYSGHKKLYSYLSENLTGGGYDSILPLVIQLGAIISLVYYLRSDLISIFKTVFSLIRGILKKEFSLKPKTREINNVYMIILAVAVFIFTPLFSKLFNEMSKNLLIISVAFLISAIFLYIADNTKEKKLSEKNETPFNAVSVGIFKLISLMPGFSAVGGMYFAGILNGFTKEFSLKFTYIITLFATFISFIKNIIGLFYNFSAIYNLFGYISAFIGALFLSGIAIYLVAMAVKKSHLKYFGFYNFIIAIFIFLIWMRG